ncbi:hypothetical protein V8B97DRAFT_683920 [Scleroderma yunnanense]
MRSKQNTKRHLRSSTRREQAQSRGRCWAICSVHWGRILHRQRCQNSSQGHHARVSNTALHSHTASRRALVDYKTFLTILNRPDGFKPAGTPGTWTIRIAENIVDGISLQRNSLEGSRCLTRRVMDSSVQANSDTS